MQGLQNYDLKAYRGMQHTCSPSEIRDAAQFISTIIPDSPELAIKPKDPSTRSIKELKAAIKSAGLGARAAGLMEKHEFVSLLTEYYNSK